jgi:hypothetical protein
VRTTELLEYTHVRGELMLDGDNPASAVIGYWIRGFDDREFIVPQERTFAVGARTRRDRDPPREGVAGVASLSTERVH